MPGPQDRSLLSLDFSSCCIFMPLPQALLSSHPEPVSSPRLTSLHLCLADARMAREPLTPFCLWRNPCPHLEFCQTVPSSRQASGTSPSPPSTFSVFLGTHPCTDPSVCVSASRPGPHFHSDDPLDTPVRVKSLYFMLPERDSLSLEHLA